VRLPWVVPAAATATVTAADLGAAPSAAAGRLLFPGPTAGRKGAYELRAVARDLGLRLRVVGRVLEAPDFWDGVDVDPVARGVPPDVLFAGIVAVVLPAWVEPSPRLLLRALARGLPVVAGRACGLEGTPGTTTVPDGDLTALRAALTRYAPRSSQRAER
jgi:hypothetical protein